MARRTATSCPVKACPSASAYLYLSLSGRLAVEGVSTRQLIHACKTNELVDRRSALRRA